MAIAEKDLVNIGQHANDGKGDSARVAFDKLNKLIIQLDGNIESGSVGYLDYASMQLDQSKPDGTIAQLTTGDRYIRLAGEWVKSVDKAEAQAIMLNEDIAKLLLLLWMWGRCKAKQHLLMLGQMKKIRLLLVLQNVAIFSNRRLNKEILIIQDGLLRIPKIVCLLV
ncbi:hypothetical protein PTQ27_00795 [Mannheimia sp. AT1]|uniref:Uncharacterized protein n=1 Tax=Mannheimia cairinae TaxID=3025936 RepID=A0ABT5MQ90_9PAST|nr:hypothetical protein [Mannheimia cairinae]MDD0823013.1 hypothetical protein [Mannheimia cairinae]